MNPSFVKCFAFRASSEVSYVFTISRALLTSYIGYKISFRRGSLCFSFKKLMNCSTLISLAFPCVLSVKIAIKVKLLIQHVLNNLHRAEELFDVIPGTNFMVQLIELIESEICFGYRLVLPTRQFQLRKALIHKLLSFTCFRGKNLSLISAARRFLKAHKKPLMNERFVCRGIDSNSSFAGLNLC